jgi:hypothetical protein
MTRVINGWLSRAAARPYPAVTRARGLPELPRPGGWASYDGEHLVAFRAPSPAEATSARAWATAQLRALDAKAVQAKLAKQAVAAAPRAALLKFQAFGDDATEALAGMDRCPVCGGQGDVDTRPGRQSDGSDATWWARCADCESEWGLRPCTGCGSRFRALDPHVGIDLEKAAEIAAPRDWPDRVLGRDVWAQPCASGESGQFRCPACGACGSTCSRCASRAMGGAARSRARGATS